MNIHVQPDVSGAAPTRHAKTDQMETGYKFLELANEYRALVVMGNDESVDDKVAEKFFERSCKLLKKMTKPDVAVNRDGKKLLAKMIFEENGGEVDFNDGHVQDLILKLLHSNLSDEVDC
jgi:hypothetical protein